MQFTKRIFECRKCPQAVLLPLPGVVLCLSQKETFLFPVCSTVLHVHVSLLYMYMFYCFRCTCFTALHVHVKQPHTPRFYTLLYEQGGYQYRKKRQMVMQTPLDRTDQVKIEFQLLFRVICSLTIGTDVKMVPIYVIVRCIYCQGALRILLCGVSSLLIVSIQRNFVKV